MLGHFGQSKGNTVWLEIIISSFLANYIATRIGISNNTHAVSTVNVGANTTNLTITSTIAVNFVRIIWDSI